MNIYESIRKREIVMPEEHTGQLGFEYAWKELLARTRQAGMTKHDVQDDVSLNTLCRRFDDVQYLCIRCGYVQSRVAVGSLSDRIRLHHL